MEKLRLAVKRTWSITMSSEHLAPFTFLYLNPESVLVSSAVLHSEDKCNILLQATDFGCVN